MYLIPADYKKQIQTDNLQQIIAGDNSILTAAELTALEEVKSFLVQKYEIAAELSETRKWDRAVQYGVGDRVYITANAYDVAATYNINDLVLQAGNVYQSIAGNVPHAFNPAEWNLLGSNFQLFYAISPYPIFNVYSPYKIGSQVFWKGRVYTCRIASVLPPFPPNIQDQYYELVPLPNVFPDDPANGVSYWGVGVSYVVTVPSVITNTTQWAVGDNRCQQVLTAAIDITLYHVHSRIAPRNIPELRVFRYMGSDNDRVQVHGRGVQFPEYSALGLLQACAEGRVTPSLTVKQPRQGGRIRYGGKIKQQNSY